MQKVSLHETLRNSTRFHLYENHRRPSQIHEAIRKSIGENLTEGEAGSFASRKDKVKRPWSIFALTIQVAKEPIPFVHYILHYMLVWGGGILPVFSSLQLPQHNYVQLTIRSQGCQGVDKNRFFDAAATLSPQKTCAMQANHTQ